MTPEYTMSVADCLPNPHKFSIMIEDLSRQFRTDYVDTIVNYCEENDMEYETVAKLLNPTLRDKLRKEFSDKRNMLPKVAKLSKKSI